jgi:hypothetical protein
MEFVSDRLPVELGTSQGVVSGYMARVMHCGREMVYASLWQIGEAPGAPECTLFAASAYLIWNGARYVLYRTGRASPPNAFWRELEGRLSDVVVVNE